MSAHLPECEELGLRGVTRTPNEDAGDCAVCTTLRACVQRVRAMRYREVEGWSDMKQARAYGMGYMEALVAARDAVAATPQHATNAATGLTAYGWAAMRQEALAAIEALRGES